MTAQPALRRRLGTSDAVVVGLGSMIGAGVFAAFGPAARVAGSWLLVGLVVAAAVAYCNAVSSAQLAAVYPLSGGTYVYAGERLGPWWGFTAGWAFVTGKTASCAAMALTFGSYAVSGPAWAQRVVAAAAVAAAAALNYRGITKTVALTRVLVASTLLVLTVFTVSALAGAHPSTLRHTPAANPYEVVQSAALLFFAFAGYARIATLGEEVRDPTNTIPRAIPRALGITVAVYGVVAVAALLTAGPRLLAGSSAPLAATADAAGRHWVAVLVRVGAAVASLGALLGLMAGIGRTALAMARGGDLPRGLAAVHPRFRVPHRAEVALAVLVAAVVLATDVRRAIGFSSCGVLVYYALANASAFTQPREQRRWPRWLTVLGLLGCLVLAATLPIVVVAVEAGLLAVGLAGRGLARRTTRRTRG